MKELIDKLLRDQATAEEEQLIARMLRKEEDIDHWLAEDETAEYDRIVNKRQAQRRYLRWGMAAAVAAILAAGTVILWPEHATQPLTAASEAVVNGRPQHVEPVADSSLVTDNTEESVNTVVAVQQPTHKKATARTHKQQPSSAVDSLQYYIARLEHELEDVSDSSYSTKAEQVIKADARLQRLVQRIMMGELTKGEQLEEARNTNESMEEQQ